MKIVKKVINNVPVTFIITKKFKSVAGALVFKRKISRKKFVVSSFLRMIMTENTKKYDTSAKLSIRAMENYDAYYCINNRRDGNYLSNSFCFKTLNDKYTEENNLSKVIDTFNEIIFNPNVNDNMFDKNTFDKKYKELEISIKRRKENQRNYASHRLCNLLNQDKAYSYDIELSDLKEITPKSLYEDYVDMIENSSVELFLAGDINPDDKVFESIVKNIKSNKNIDTNLYISNDDENEEYKEYNEKGYGMQGVLSMILYLKNITSYEINYVMPIYNVILGGGSDSRLFNSVRKDNSLAYYCFSRLEKDDNLIQIIAGIEKENLKKAIDIIKDTLDGMNNITDDEIENAKKELSSGLIGSQDDILNVIFRKAMENMYNLPDCFDYIEKLNNVTKEEIINMNKKVFLGFSYYLEENNE